MLGGIPAQMLSHAVHTAARVGEHGHVGIVNIEAERAQPAVQLGAIGGGQHAIVAERDDIAAERHGAPEVDGQDLDSFRFEPRDDFWIRGIKTDRGKLVGKHA